MMHPKQILLGFFLFLIGFFASAQSLTIDQNASFIVEGNAATTADGKLIIDGDLLLNGVLTLKNDAVVTLSGDYIKNTGTLNAGQSTFIFTGSANQSITKTAAGPAITESFHNVTIDKSSGTLTIDGVEVDSVFVLNILDPKQGTLTTSDKLVLAASDTNYGRIAYGVGLITGEVEIEKRLSNTTGAWRQLGMPISGTWQNGQWAGISLNFANHLPASEINSYLWNSNSSNIADYCFGWEVPQVSTGGDVPLTIYLDAALPAFAVQQTFSCKGSLSTSATHVFNLNDTRDPADIPATGPNGNGVIVSKGWNLIPNPYPALLDVFALLNNNTPQVFDPAYKAVHVFNSITNQYQPILRDNVVTKTVWNVNATEITANDANIPPFQAFWVKADAPGQVVTLNRSELQTTVIKNFGNETFMKQTPDLFRLNVFDADSLWDQVVVYFSQDATREFDQVGDAYFLKSMKAEMPGFYALESNIPTSIVARPLDITDSVEIGYESTKTGKPFYVFPDLAELPDGWFVYLKDKHTNKTVRVNSREALPFTHLGNAKQNRFVVYFSKNEHAFAHLTNGDERKIDAFVLNGQIAVQSLGIEGPVELAIYDLVGRQLQHKQVYIEAGEQLIFDTPIQESMILLRVTYPGKTAAFKLFL